MLWVVNAGGLPRFIILGAQKAGTSSLYSYLAQHPSVLPASVKEVHFFDLNYHRGLDWYRSNFAEVPADGPITGEASPYYLFHPHAAARCARTLPGAKFVIMLRDPVCRAYSHYHHNVRMGHETVPFEEALDMEQARIHADADRMLEDCTYCSEAHRRFSYLARGRYREQILRWHAHFPADRFLILISEQFFSSPRRGYQRVLNFLDLPEYELNKYSQVMAGAYPPMQSNARRRLAEYFEPFNRELLDYLQDLQLADRIQTPVQLPWLEGRTQRRRGA